MNRSFLVLSVGLLAVCMMSSFAAPPAWWTNDHPPVVDGGAAANNKGPANIGQAKWMAKNALEALRAVDPACAAAVETDLVGTGKAIANWNIAVTDPEKAAQHAPLLIGQLKAISAPFYDRLHSLSPDWLANERVLNGTLNAGTHFPWTTAVADDANKAVANVGQLKAVFSLRFESLPQSFADNDEDGISDHWEVTHFETIAACDPSEDADGDGRTNAQEYAEGSDPNDPDSHSGLLGLVVHTTLE